MSLRNRRRAGGGGGAVVRLPSLSPARPGASQRNPIELSDSQRRWARSSKEHSLVFMRPVDFLALTAAGHPETFTKSAAALEVYNQSTARGETLIPPHLELEIDAAGQAHVSGHEGRHRAAAMVNAGEGRNQTMPVYLRIKYWQDKWRDRVRRELGQGDSYTNTDYLLGWDNIPSVIYPQFAGGRAVYKADLDVVEPYVQDEARRAREAVGKTANGLHHTDHPGRYDEDEDIGVPWGFITAKGEVINGLDEDEGVDNHDTLAITAKLAPGSSPHPEDDAIWRGNFRFIFYKRGREYELGVDGSSNKGRHDVVAKTILRGVERMPMEPRSMEVLVSTTNTPYGSQKTVFRLEGATSLVKAGLRRIAAGEDVGVVERDVRAREAVGVRNPAYVHDNDSREWGFLDPAGKVVDGNKLSFSTRPYGALHDDLANHLHHVKAEVLMGRGWVRFAVLSSGEPVFGVAADTEELQWKALANIARYLTKSPHVSGEVKVDVHNYDGVGLHTARFEHEEHAARVLSRSATSRQFVGPEWKVYNPDWSRESMKTITAWGWISPDGRDIVGRRKDKTHNELAQTAGLGHSWQQATASGAVRYIIFTDGHLGLTLTRTPEAARLALRVVARPEVRTASIEWFDPETWRIEQTGGMEARKAEMALRAAVRGSQGRESNPYDAHAAGWRWNGKWIIYGPTGRVLGTVWGRDIPAARHNLRPHVRKLGLATAQEAHLRPWPSATPEERAAADPRYGGVEIGIEQGVE